MTEKDSPYIAPSATITDAPSGIRPTRRAVKAGLVAWWISMPVSILLVIVDMEMMSPELRAMDDALNATEQSAAEFVALVLMSIGLLGGLLASIALFVKAGAAREWAFILFNLGTWACVPFLGPSLETGIGAANDVETLAIGFTFGAIVCDRWQRAID